MRLLPSLSALVRRLWLALALVVILYALLIVAGRQLLPLLERYQPQINSFLSEQLAIDLEVDRIGGHWLRLTPVIDIDGLKIYAEQRQTRGVSVSRLSAELDLWNSLIDLAPVWEVLSAERVELVANEDAQGRWRVAGLKVNEAGGDALRYLLDVLSASRLLRIDNLRVSLNFYSGAAAVLYGRDIFLESEDLFHRATARLSLDGELDDAARLVFEGRGDLDELASLDGRGYLELNRVNFTGALRTLAERWLPGRVNKIGEVETALDARFWFDWRDGAIENGQGTIRAAELPLNWMAEAPPLRDFRAEVTGWFRPGADWGLQLQSVQGHWRQEHLAVSALRFSQGVGGRWRRMSLAASRVDLDQFHRLMLDTGILPDRFQTLVASLAPSGQAQRLAVDLDLSAPAAGLRLRTELKDVAVQSWRNAPAARGVNGYLSVDGRRGFLELDSPQGFAMHYPKVYEHYMEHGAVRGRVDWHWRPSQHLVEVTGGPITIDGEEGRGTAFLALNLPLRRELGPPRMTLMVGMRDSHSRFRDRYIPQVLNPNLRQWLADAVGEADVAQAGFIWRGSLARREAEGRTVQLFVEARNGHLAFQPGWPALEGMDARIMVDDGAMSGTIDSAGIGGLSVTESAVTVRRRQPDGLLLTVDGEAAGGAGDALAVLRQSPLGHRIAGLDGWQVSGNVDLDLDLAIPLAADKAGQRYQVTGRLRQASLSIPGTDLAVTDVDGRLSYSLPRGLYGDNLRGRFLGRPLKAEVATTDSETRVSLAGTLSAPALVPYLGAHSERISGQTAITGDLILPAGDAEEPPQLHLGSDLKGLVVDLPPPLALSAPATESLTAKVMFYPERMDIAVDLSSLASARLELADGRFRRGELRFGGEPARLPARSGLAVTGRIEHLDWGRWQPVLLGADGVRNGARLTSLAPRLDLSVAHFALQNFDMGRLAITGNRSESDGWRLQVAGERLDGTVRIPGRGAPVIRLDRLQLAEWPDIRQEAQARGLSDFDPASIPELDFLAKAIEVDGDNWGNLGFVSSRLEDGISIDRLRGEIRGIQIGGPAGQIDSDTDGGEPEAEEIPDSDTLAQLRWRRSGGQHSTAFSGTLTTGDMGDVLEAWGLPRVLDSEHAGFYADLRWQGEPWRPELAELEGYLGIDMEDGHFYRSPGGAANAFLKLVGLFNFDTWLRRLRFDFSDLFSQGVSFDRVRGGLAFDDGTMVFDDPVVASMPSGKVRLLGRADILTEQLDARLVATMPIGTNLPWVAALVGGLPAAAGVYLTGLLFEKQVDQLSSISYDVTGSWDDPRLEVDKIFSDGAD